MGDIADGLIDGTFDSLTGEYLGEGPGYPRTMNKSHAKSTDAQYVKHADSRITFLDHDPENYIKGTKAIRKELALLIKAEKAKIDNITSKQENIIVEKCRRAMNIKYGKGWREQF